MSRSMRIQRQGLKPRQCDVLMMMSTKHPAASVVVKMPPLPLLFSSSPLLMALLLHCDGCLVLAGDSRPLVQYEIINVIGLDLTDNSITDP